jgi:apolipoprotein N-acyltransferase
MIQTARFGGVYAVGFLILLSNAGLAYALTTRTFRALIILILMLSGSAGIVYLNLEYMVNESAHVFAEPEFFIVGVQPNVPMESVAPPAENKLLAEHLSLSKSAIPVEPGRFDSLSAPAAKVNPWSSWFTFSDRLVIWPESPMNFSYSRDPHLRQVVGDFAKSNHVSILLNSLEPAKDGSDQNSAILVNEKGEMSARYDKIRLMPFGEYVPLPHWLPGASSVRGIVGEFTPGSSYTLMPLGAVRAGVFICIEAAHPGIARNFTNAGADVLINISNDGYLGPTPVMRQHLANVVFRAVENDRDVVRVTNSGITALIGSNGTVYDATTGFHEDVRSWTISRGANGVTFYSKHGDVFVYGCALISLGFISASFMRRRVV